MKKDKIYYAYLTLLLEEQQRLPGEERWWTKTDRTITETNLRCHDGMSVEATHQHLKDSITDSYHADAFSEWFRHGGNAPVVQYVRKIARKYTKNPSGILEPAIGGVLLHENIVHQDAIKSMHTLHSLTQQRLPASIDHVTIFRGVHVKDENNQYVPNSLESWTGDERTAHDFSSYRIKEGHSPVILKATVPRHGILMSYNAGIGLMPPEDELKGKKEYTVFGHSLNNIERIK